jgi:hypothetical protein
MGGDVSGGDTGGDTGGGGDHLFGEYLDTILLRFFLLVAIVKDIVCKGYIICVIKFPVSGVVRNTTPNGFRAHIGARNLGVSNLVQTVPPNIKKLNIYFPVITSPAWARLKILLRRLGVDTIAVQIPCRHGVTIHARGTLPRASTLYAYARRKSFRVSALNI